MDLVLLGGTPIDSMKQQLFHVFECSSNQNLISQDKLFNPSSESTEFYTMEQFGYSSDPHIVSHNGAF